MKKHIGFFIIMTTFCAAMLALVMTENIRDAVLVSRGDEPYDPLRSDAIRKKFESMGLTLHEARYWK